ncbi:50S ribosomal protein L9 [Candidatus Campbellbacteria bacterium CG22_combo_CG10-13_8_21_14_all_36_13]|uniref:Large ribosomal subunit protein bL9 n=1 Tax=Candidatus Campbellbacteria bacterium CG22_combo_CG10-13_8_21_14_all_36_13 TaxID=1974529 RepID=A0A2H0DZB8_9BACT|nr:MAG: 50S ribosomal protein L9 [Candidatus Campbellbacteria bacterium CG22_combo_CG10-13_8_21_14_all_36_13]
MRVILLKDVPKIGHKFDIKEVKPGYGQNFLIKNGLAIIATKQNEQKMQKEMHAHIEESRMKSELLEKSIEGLENSELLFTGKVNEKGHLFDKVDVRDIKEALKEQLHLELDEKHIHLESPIKEVGEGSVVVKVGDKKATVKLKVEAE